MNPPAPAWVYPASRYYYAWYEASPFVMKTTDGDVKHTVVERLRENPRTAPDDITVDVKKGVVIFGLEDRRGSRCTRHSAHRPD